MMRIPEAYFDTLQIIQSLQRFGGGITHLQLQRLAYLACLLGVYRKQPMADWGYSFSSTDFGTPFSPSLEDAWQEMAAAGHIVLNFVSDGSVDVFVDEPIEPRGTRRASLSMLGEQLCHGLANLRNLAERLPFLRAACDSSIVVSSYVLHAGLMNEPTCKSGRNHPDGAALLSGPAATTLYKQLSAVKAVLQTDEEDLFTPSVTWLRYSADEPRAPIEERSE